MGVKGIFQSVSLWLHGILFSILALIWVLLWLPFRVGQMLLKSSPVYNHLKEVFIQEVEKVKFLSAFYWEVNYKIQRVQYRIGDQAIILHVKMKSKFQVVQKETVLHYIVHLFKFWAFTAKYNILSIFFWEVTGEFGRIHPLFIEEIWHCSMGYGTMLLWELMRIRKELGWSQLKKRDWYLSYQWGKYQTEVVSQIWVQNGFPEWWDNKIDGLWVPLNDNKTEAFQWEEYLRIKSDLVQSGQLRGYHPQETPN